jgi:hypothetical protein
MHQRVVLRFRLVCPVWAPLAVPARQATTASTDAADQNHQRRAKRDPREYNSQTASNQRRDEAYDRHEVQKSQSPSGVQPLARLEHASSCSWSRVDE